MPALATISDNGTPKKRRTRQSIATAMASSSETPKPPPKDCDSPAPTRRSPRKRKSTMYRKPGLENIYYYYTPYQQPPTSASTTQSEEQPPSPPLSSQEGTRWNASGSGLDMAPSPANTRYADANSPSTPPANDAEPDSKLSPVATFSSPTEAQPSPPFRGSHADPEPAKAESSPIPNSNPDFEPSSAPVTVTQPSPADTATTSEGEGDSDNDEKQSPVDAAMDTESSADSGTKSLFENIDNSISLIKKMKSADEETTENETTVCKDDQPMDLSNDPEEIASSKDLDRDNTTKMTAFSPSNLKMATGNKKTRLYTVFEEEELEDSSVEEEATATATETFNTKRCKLFEDEEPKNLRRGSDGDAPSKDVDGNTASYSSLEVTAETKDEGRIPPLPNNEGKSKDGLIDNLEREGLHDDVVDEKDAKQSTIPSSSNIEETMRDENKRLPDEGMTGETGNVDTNTTSEDKSAKDDTKTALPYPSKVEETMDEFNETLSDEGVTGETGNISTDIDSNTPPGEKSSKANRRRIRRANRRRTIVFPSNEGSTMDGENTEGEEDNEEMDDERIEDETESIAEDVDTNTISEDGSTTSTTQITRSSPSDMVDIEVESPVRSKSRLSLLLTLRPPPPTKPKILRRKCIPGKKGTVYDGTARELVASTPTSDRHFVALTAFETSITQSIATAYQKNAAKSDLFVIDLETLCQRLNHLFPKQFPRRVSANNLFQPPCILPRLIACYTIYRDYQRQQEDEQIQERESPPNKQFTPRNSRTPVKRRRTRLAGALSAAVESLSPIRDLLQKLVDLERVVLEGHEHRDDDEGKSTDVARPSKAAKKTFASCWKKPLSEKQDNRKRRVQFGGFADAAVVRAPCDVLEDSYKPLDNYVKALTSVLNTVEELYPKETQSFSATETRDRSASSDATAIARDFIFYLEEEFVAQCHDTVCVESFMAIESQNIPIERVKKAAIAYSKDLDSLLNPKGNTAKKTLAVALADERKIDEGGVTVHLSIQTEYVFVRSRPLSWECRLANTSAQLVRYWLRTLMNPIPERALLEMKTDQWNSRLFDHVDLNLLSAAEEYNTQVNRTRNGVDIDTYVSDDEYSTDETFDDDKISSLLSNAIAHLFSYLDLGSSTGLLSALAPAVSWKDRLRKVIPDETCCDTIFCREGFGSSRKPLYVTEDDWQELREHLEKASDFCAFHRRALFTERLLSILEKLDWVDHWTNTVQAAAEKLLWMKASYDKHSSTSQNAEDSLADATSTLTADDSVAPDRVILPEDEHLVLLGIPLKDLLHRLRTEVLPLSCHRYEVCRANLRRTEKNFRLGASTTKRKKMCQPHIGELEAYWEEWLHPDTIFPSISFRG